MLRDNLFLIGLSWLFVVVGGCGSYIDPNSLVSTPPPAAGVTTVQLDCEAVYAEAIFSPPRDEGVPWCEGEIVYRSRFWLLSTAEGDYVGTFPVFAVLVETGSTSECRYVPQGAQALPTDCGNAEKVIAIASEGDSSEGFPSPIAWAALMTFDHPSFAYVLEGNGGYFVWGGVARPSLTVTVYTLEDSEVRRYACFHNGQGGYESVINSDPGSCIVE